MFNLKSIILSLLVGIVILYTVPAQSHSHNNIIVAGGQQCQTYDCQLAQQEIQYLYDAIYYEQQKPYPNWQAIEQAKQRIRWLMTIR